MRATAINAISQRTSLSSATVLQAGTTTQSRYLNRIDAIRCAWFFSLMLINVASPAFDALYQPGGAGGGTCSTVFTDLACWSNLQLPGANDELLFNSPTTPVYSVNLVQDSAVQRAAFERGFVGVLFNTFTLETNFLDVASMNNAFADVALVNGVLDLGTVSVGSGDNASGRLTLAGIDASIRGLVSVGFGSDSGIPSDGALELINGSQINAANAMLVGFSSRTPGIISEVIVRDAGSNLTTQTLHAAAYALEFDDLDDLDRASLIDAGQAKISVEDGGSLVAEQLFIGASGELVVDGGTVSADSLIFGIWMA